MTFCSQGSTNRLVFAGIHYLDKKVHPLTVEHQCHYKYLGNGNIQLHNHQELRSASPASPCTSSSLRLCTWLPPKTCLYHQLVNRTREMHTSQENQHIHLQRPGVSYSSEQYSFKLAIPCMEVALKLGAGVQTFIIYIGAIKRRYEHTGLV